MKQQIITVEDFLSALAKLSEIDRKLDRINKYLNGHPSFKDEEKDELLTIEQACEFTSLARQTIYGFVSDRKIPFIKPKGTKRLRFSKTELSNWMIGGKRKAKTTYRR